MQKIQCQRHSYRKGHWSFCERNLSQIVLIIQRDKSHLGPPCLSKFYADCPLQIEVEALASLLAFAPRNRRPCQNWYDRDTTYFEHTIPCPRGGSNWV
jgi:hypothetical protein